MTDQALYAAHIAKAREIVVASVKRLRSAHVDCIDLMEQAERYLHSTWAIDHFHAVYDADLTFEPNDQRTIAGLANVGSTLFELLSPTIPSHTPNEALTEAINHLINMRTEARLHNQNGEAL
ncbi:hypothetical protein [Burkholderia sp. JKS000303]|uniref:hypothetical protein n=1 Tax=Burkholderia sp. JKS000303 TaxID=1938747 RepID=UPI000BF8E4AE|nr:hypothetical protein [Burkholderia sp. JKS000303]PFH28554.1 hypothetical protein BX604_2310 [Burkholderia sp. JKS000303]